MWPRSRYLCPLARADINYKSSPTRTSSQAHPFKTNTLRLLTRSVGALWVVLNRYQRSPPGRNCQLKTNSTRILIPQSTSQWRSFLIGQYSPINTAVNAVNSLDDKQLKHLLQHHGVVLHADLRLTSVACMPRITGTSLDHCLHLICTWYI
ncbi:hypothetical protein PILCRDRAFT_664958 [Piloderma croceum F 1598]|uniref:Uncharacterized protein n=1 Tax=Piloderma croceum (strain F 1598) TaxID=765440 RepID=A0A0C3F7A7_PILCF|nr:hypothetical protein PILCRDRAFT_664958 [Piloderma croceum F 1598]